MLDSEPQGMNADIRLEALPQLKLMYVGASTFPSIVIAQSTPQNPVLVAKAARFQSLTPNQLDVAAAGACASGSRE